MKRHITMTASLKARAALPFLGLCLLALSPVPPATAAAAGSDRAALPVLTSVTARHVGNVDRVVFKFTGGVPSTVFPEWVDTLVHDGSGLPVRVAGAKVLSVSMNGAAAHDASGSTVDGRTAFALPNVITAVGAGDFEGSVLFGLGVQKQTTFHVRVQAHRVVVDVGAAFPTSLRKVFLVDSNAHVAPVQRRVPASSPAGATLQSLFAGPTPSERANGLRLVRSRATGFDQLAIAGGIARLRLTGGCASGGSTTTVASEIVPTLKQFPSVDWVKISDRNGHTETPSGSSDSIPACLEP
jgi:Sporulation and spore germination